MNLFTFLAYFIFAGILFFILNYFDRKSEDANLIHVVFPFVYLLLVAGMFSGIGLKSWNQMLYFIIVFELLIRLYYVKSILKRDSMVNNQYYFKIYLLTILGSYFLVSCFIAKVDTVFPSAEEMRTGIWFLVIVFAYFLLKDQVKVEVKKERATFIEKKQEYVLMQYAKFKNQYFSMIRFKKKDSVLSSLFYAIMIYENYRRPKFFRKIDLIRFRLFGRKGKMGIMQIPTDTEIDDEKSIKLSLTSLEKAYLKIKEEHKKTKEAELVKLYLESSLESEIYRQDVFNIYETIITFDAK